MGDTVYIPHPEYCDLCKSQGLQVEAAYDGKTVHGPWAYMCEEHFGAMGVGLGTGRGQRLIVGEKPESSSRGVTEVDDEDETDETIASNANTEYGRTEPVQAEELTSTGDEDIPASPDKPTAETPVAEVEMEKPAKKRKRLRAARRRRSIAELASEADFARTYAAKNAEPNPAPAASTEEQDEEQVPYIMKMDWGDLSR